MEATVYFFLAMALVWTFLICTPQSASAQANSTRLKVTARIATFFQLHVGFQSSFLIISDADVARGYVDVHAATSFTVTTNTLEPYLVDFRPVKALFSAVVVSGAESPIQIGPQGGTAVFRAAHGRVVSHRLDYRFILPSDLAPGTYPWPLELSVRSA
jgi:hypothetical protein